MKSAMGTKLKIGAYSIASLKSIGGMDIKADTIETTTLDSTGGYRTFMQGLKDGGEVPISGFFEPSDVNGQIALYNALGTGELLDFSVLFPSALGASWDFQGIVTGIKTDAAMEDAVPFEATIKVSGQPSLGLTPSGGLTALSLTGTGGALTPTFSNGSYSYAFTGVTGASITVSATAANHTLQLYVDGNLVQTLTSGSPSSAIAMASIGSKKLTILATEPGKTTKTYEIIAVKTA